MTLDKWFSAAAPIPSGRLTPLGSLPSADGNFFSRAFGINDRGQVAGESSVQQDLSHAYVWSPKTGMKDIDGRVGGGSSARAINNRGQVVGTRWPADARGNSAFYWDNSTGMVNLFDLIDPADPLRESLVIQNGYKINNRGDVALWATIEGRPVAVVLTPVRP